ncbi:MAG: SPOR domain-containing protein [Bacteroidales bacterium]|nr:SPOR domain-containing protein [Bacteroidales bacterium]
MMIKQVSKTFVAALVLLLFFTGSCLYGQQQPDRRQELKESSLSHFNQGHFRAALSGFRSLMEVRGRDPFYSYYTGRCLVELNEELDEAIELLYGASKSSDFPDAVFYLGRAYHLHYNFRDARNCYEKYEMLASRQDRKKLDVKHLISTCRSAMEITSSYNPYEVMNVTFMDLSDSLQFTQVKMKGGELNKKPEAYFLSDEDPEALTGLMFIPKDPVRGDYLYFSGYSRSRKDGAQIFRVRKGAGKSWGDPEEVAALNSSGDEILPYFDPIENDLYFASDGRLGVGGFDLYKSHYDKDRDQWTDPVNLGFPVNSVMDEYLLLPGSDLGMVLFFSTRMGTDSTVTVYRVHLVEPKKEVAPDDHQRLREIARLGGAAEMMLAGIGKAGHSLPVSKKTPVSKNDFPPAGDSKEPEIEQVSIYRESLAGALRHQAVSDSLKDLAAIARIKVRESDDSNDRWVWQKQIMVWEKRARDEEAEADLLYAEMEKKRPESASSKTVHPPETIVVDRVVDGLTVYRYAEPEHKEKPGVGTSRVKTPPVSSVVHSFDILTRSPYSEVNPIPMDLRLPSGTFYRIQLGAFGAEVEPDAFGGISPITGEHVEGKGLVKYYAGKFSRYQDASTAIPRVHSQGYEDAFIVAWYHGIMVSTQKAKQLE